MRTDRLGLLLALAGLGCASASRSDATSVAATGGNGAAAAAVTDGRQVFENVCATCHSIEPPAVAAPPMSHVVRHYREVIADDAEGVVRIAEWIRAPHAERSLMPAHAIERWGIMAPLTLPEDQRMAVAAYVWTLGATPAPGGPGRMMGRRSGH